MEKIATLADYAKIGDSASLAKIGDSVFTITFIEDSDYVQGTNVTKGVKITTKETWDWGEFYKQIPHYKSGHSQEIQQQEAEKWRKQWQVTRPRQMRFEKTIIRKKFLQPSWRVKQVFNLFYF